MGIYDIKYIWFVVEVYLPLWKQNILKFANWDDFSIPNWMETWEMLQTTNQQGFAMENHHNEF